MIKRISLWFFLLFAAFLGKGESAEISVTSWNVLANSYVRPEYYPNHSVEEIVSVERAENVIGCLKNMSSDVFLLQEVEYEQYQRIESALRALGYKGFFAPKAAGRPDGIATFFRSSSLNFLGAQTMYYLDGYKEGYSGNVLQMIIIELEGKKLGLASTHILYDREGDASRCQAGKAQIMQLIKCLQRNKDVDSWIIGGDFNGEVHLPRIQLMLSAGFIDLGQKSGDPTFGHPFPRRIDYLFHSTEMDSTLLPVEFSWENEYLPTKQWPSDHLPVQGVFRL